MYYTKSCKGATGIFKQIKLVFELHNQVSIFKMNSIDDA